MDGSCIRKGKVAYSKISGYVWTEPLRRLQRMQSICISDHGPSIIGVAAVLAMGWGGGGSKYSWKRGVVSQRRLERERARRRVGGAIKKNHKHKNTRTKQKIR